MSKLENITFHLVDDNDIDIAVNTKLLNLAKISTKIRSYNNAQDFLNYVNSTEFDSSSPHVILLDIMMPDINGFECLDRLVELPDQIKNQIKVYMVSSSIDRNDIRKAESYSLVEKVLEKPLDIYLLKRYLEDAYA